MLENCTLTYTNELAIEEAISVLDKAGKGILVFVDNDNKLLGIITDGDIRRGFLRKEVKLENLINKSPETMSASTPKREIIARLKSLHRRHMPLIDEKRKLISLFSLDDIEFNSRPNKVVIMAGGLGSRLGELTKDTPKPMLKVGNKPMLLHLINMFSEYGFRRFVLCVNYKKEVIKEFFGNGDKFGVEIEYVEESDRLGTAGALFLAKPLLDNDFFVINGDVVVNVDMEELFAFHQESKAIATMCVREYSHQIPYGVIQTNDDSSIKAIVEKPVTSFNINAGIYILSPSSLESLSQATYLDMPDLFSMIIDKGQQTRVYQLADTWYDVGRREDLQAARKALSID